MRTALSVLGGLALSIVADRLLRVPHEDPLRTTLVLVPALLGAILGIEAWMRTRGLEPLSSRERRSLAGLGVTVLVGALAWRSLGIVVADWLVFGAFLLVLGYWLLRTLVRLRPLLGERLRGRPSAIFFWLPLVLYLAITPWSTEHRPPDGDEPFNLLLAHSLAYDFDVDLTNNYAESHWRFFLDRTIAPQPGDPVGPEGEIYSRHNPMLPLVLAPAYRLFGKLGALAVIAAFTAALAWSTLRLARHYFADRPAECLAVYALLAFTPPLLLYAHQIWVEIPGALLVVLSLNGLLSLRRDEPLGRQRGTIFRAVAPILFLPLIKLRLALLAGPLVALLWWRKGRGSRASLVIAGLLGAAATALLVFNYVRFGNPLRVHQLGELNLANQPLRHLVTGFSGLFLDGAFGLLFCAPLWWLLLPGSLLCLRRREPLLFDIAVVSLPYLAVVSLMSGWYGGWSPPFRFGIVVLPLLALTLVPALEQRHRPGARLMLGALGGLSLVMTLVWVLHPGLTYDLASGTMRMSDLSGSRLGADFTRLLPSFVRIRPATFVWVFAGLLGLGLWWLPGRSDKKETPALGIAFLLLLLGAAALLANRLPTRIVEFEDSFVQKAGGEDYPDIWNPDRSYYRVSWRLFEGNHLVVPVVTGGAEVSIEIDVLYDDTHSGATRLRLHAGDEVLEVRELGSAKEWTTLSFGPHPWPKGAPLVLIVEAEGPRNRQLSSVILDRARFEWR